LQPIERHDSRKLQSKVTCLIVDSEFCLAVELKDDNASNSVDASGFATYSNSESTVATYISISETLWMQSELQERN
jgi:two-component system, OmpR family, sensor histidine kinase VicK